jgi:hypothetical protein
VLPAGLVLGIVGATGILVGPITPWLMSVEFWGALTFAVGAAVLVRWVMRQ